MNELIPGLGDHLVQQADALAANPTPRVGGRSTRPARARRSLRPGRRGGLATVLVACLVSGTALAATGHWHPFAAHHHVTRSQARTIVPPSRRASLSVLARPQDAADRSTFVRAAVRAFEGNSGVVKHPSYARYLGQVRAPLPVVDGRHRTKAASLLLVPAQQPANAPAVICLAIAADSWPARASHPTTWLDPSPIVYGTPPVRPARLVDRIEAGGTCARVRGVRRYGLSLGTAASGVMTGVAPDDVVQARDTTTGGRIITAKVEGNAYQLIAPDHHFKPGHLQWVLADGTVNRHPCRALQC